MMQRGLSSFSPTKVILTHERQLEKHGGGGGGVQGPFRFKLAASFNGIQLFSKALSGIQFFSNVFQLY